MPKADGLSTPAYRGHRGTALAGRAAVRSRALAGRRAGTGVTEKELKRPAGLLAPLQMPRMSYAEPPPRDNHFGSPLKLSRVHWVRPEMVVEMTYLTWT
jgi:ATP-dependent DNA ligase